MPIERRDEWLAAARGISHERWVSARRSLAPNGTLLSNGGGHAGGALGRVIRLTIVSMFVHQQGKPSPKFQNRADLEVLKGLVEAGKVTPVIDGTYPLRETPRAIGHVAAGHAKRDGRHRRVMPPATAPVMVVAQQLARRA